MDSRLSSLFIRSNVDDPNYKDSSVELQKKATKPTQRLDKVYDYYNDNLGESFRKVMDLAYCLSVEDYCMFFPPDSPQAKEFRKQHSEHYIEVIVNFSTEDLCMEDFLQKKAS